jgi:hypothetical protein
MVTAGMPEHEIRGRLFAAHRNLSQDEVDYYLDIVRATEYGMKKGKHFALIGEKTRQFGMWMQSRLRKESA